ncbi:MAG: hypothetical protein Pg6A_20080 [Termitinemataceae bacterium]|nr:MAG: hypothetical protein Pg6A_20080 [Termitinemataceae bacterium]
MDLADKIAKIQQFFGSDATATTPTENAGVVRSNFVRGGSGFRSPALPSNYTVDTLDDKTMKETERLSRLADRINNRLYWKPGVWSSAAGLPGMTGQGQWVGGGVYQMPKIETEDMRQQRVNVGQRTLSDSERRKLIADVARYYHLDKEKVTYMNQLAMQLAYYYRIGIPIQQTQAYADIMAENPNAAYALMAQYNMTGRAPIVLDAERSQEVRDNALGINR